MSNLRPYERHDLFRALKNCPRHTTRFHCSWIPVLLTVLAGDADATPIHSNAQNPYQRRDPSEKDQSLGPKIWIPAIVVLVALFCIALIIWTRRYLRKTTLLLSFSGASPPGAPAVGGPGAPRELTAEQLAGTINVGNRPSNAPRTRRPRRPRRTPSQMSVTSLPEYNKEPGEEELVIFRGRDMEDATMPAAVVRSSADDDRASMSSQDQSQVSQYLALTASPPNTSLLPTNNSTEGDRSLRSLPSLGEERTGRSVDIGSQETSSLLRVESNSTPDPRGEAPSYFEVEVVDLDERLENSELSPASPNTSPEPNPRRSGFRNLLNRMSMASHATRHDRTDSSQSAISSSMSHGHDPSAGRGGSGHRAMPSGSGSPLTASVFRTISRQRSNHTLNSNRLNSPSLISLNSISAPLTHTVTRTEFTYPKTGPTAEQLKVISSRESFARFGVPYGPDAIAFAASSSRQDLLPPPDFDSAVPEAASPRSSSRLGPSRLRSTSNVVESMTQSSSARTPQPRSTSPPGSTRLERQLGADASTAQPERSSSISKNDNSLSRPATPPAGSENTSSSHPRTSSSTEHNVSEFGKLSTSPPSSYHDLTDSSTRSESRASVNTFLTAAESLTSPPTAMLSGSWHGSVSSDVGDSMYGSGPSTPRLGGQHMLEQTDATIMPGPVRVVS